MAKQKLFALSRYLHIVTRTGLLPLLSQELAISKLTYGSSRTQIQLNRNGVLKNLCLLMTLDASGDGGGLPND